MDIVFWDAVSNLEVYVSTQDGLASDVGLGFSLEFVRAGHQIMILRD